jgi:hypothetical protein
MNKINKTSLAIRTGRVGFQLWEYVCVMYDLELSRRHCIIKSSRATSRVNWSKYEDTDVSRTITALVLRVLKNPEDREDFIMSV